MRKGMKHAMNTNQITKLIHDVCLASKTDMIGSLPCAAVSGDKGNGFFCTPDSLADIAYLEHIENERARANNLAGVMRFAMQKAQAALKADDKKNKITDENAGEHSARRLAVAQTAFAGAISGKTESSFNDSSILRAEATRMFIANKVLPWAKAQGKDTSDSALDQYRAAIEKDNAAAYPGWIESLMGEVAKSRTYVVNRKGAVDGVKVETATFNFDTAA